MANDIKTGYLLIWCHGNFFTSNSRGVISHHLELYLLVLFSVCFRQIEKIWLKSGHNFFFNQYLKKSFSFLEVIGIEPTSSQMLEKHSTNESQPKPEKNL
jgi:hypothetical protein